MFFMSSLALVVFDVDEVLVAFDEGSGSGEGRDGGVTVVMFSLQSGLKACAPLAATSGGGGRWVT